MERPVRTIVVGDVMLDRYLCGSIDRVSPEAPVPILKVERTFHRPGGAAHVAANIHSLGGEPRLVGVVGEDDAAAALAGVLEESGVSARWLVPSSSCPTTTKTRLLAGQFQTARFDLERSPAPIDVTRCVSTLESLVADADAIVVSDYAKGACTPEVCRVAIASGRSRGLPVVVDPKEVDFTKYSGATVVTPNRKEAMAATGLPIGDVDAAIAAATALRSRFSFEWVVITLGEQGMVAVSADERHVLPTAAKLVYDVTGAGDTVVATLARCLARGTSMIEACRFANIAAGIQVSHVGATQVHWSEVLRAEAMEDGGRGKIVDLDALLESVLSCRSRGERIGFTNGCFDILHHGHVALLEAAARECDRLVVAVNSDSSVRRLKGAPRPFVSAKHRKAVLAGLEAVSYVVEFEEDTPLNVIRALQPDVLIKGGDYNASEVVGADVVTARGGRVITPLFVNDVSTTNIVERIVSERGRPGPGGG